MGNEFDKVSKLADLPKERAAADKLIASGTATDF